MFWRCPAVFWAFFRAPSCSPSLRPTPKLYNLGTGEPCPLVLSSWLRGQI